MKSLHKAFHKAILIAKLKRNLKRPILVVHQGDEMNESQHQAALMSWAGLYKEAQYLFAIPNGTHIKSHQGRAKAKREGLKSGVPDLFLPVARNGFHGLFIELKKPKTAASPAGKASKQQLQWQIDLNEQGYMAVICVGWDAARETIEGYLR